MPVSVLADHFGCAGWNQLEQVQASIPGSHWAKDMFTAHTLLDMQANTEALVIYEALSPRFGASPYIKGQIAQALYNLRGMGLSS